MGRDLRDLDHTGISCPSKGGKSYLARHLVKKFRRAGTDVLFCDPLGYRWPANYVTTDLDELMEKAKACRNCALFIDELGMTRMSREVDRYKWFYTTSRHNGHVCYTMMQDYTQAPPACRKQFTQLYLFNCHPDEAEEWAHQFHRDRDFILKTAPVLPRYHFIRLRSFEAAQGPMVLAK
jgi:hypothetical protein